MALLQIINLCISATIALVYAYVKKHYFTDREYLQKKKRILKDVEEKLGNLSNLPRAQSVPTFLARNESSADNGIDRSFRRRSIDSNQPTEPQVQVHHVEFSGVLERPAANE